MWGKEKLFWSLNYWFWRQSEGEIMVSIIETGCRKGRLDWGNKMYGVGGPCDHSLGCPDTLAGASSF